MNNTILNLETLNSEYNIILKKYEQILSDYSNFLQEQQTPEPLISITGQAFWGTKALSTTTSPNVTECKALCSSTTNCSGATYTSNTNQCWLRTGTGTPIPAADTSYAIITQNMEYLLTLQYLNQRLTTINDNILKAIEQGQPLYDEQNKNKQIKKYTLQNNFAKLNEERESIDKTIKEFQNLNEAQIESNLSVNQNYYSYIFLLFFAIFIIIMLIKFVPSDASNVKYGGGILNNNTYFIIFAIILIIFCIIFQK